MFSFTDKNILIVDDQKAFHVMLRTMLTNQGADAKKIAFAENAEVAAKLAKRTDFDLFLIDYNLGSGKNGVQLIDYLRTKKLISNSALCFIITGDNNKGMVLTAMEKSPDDYLMKPFSQTQLLNRLRKAAQKKSMLVDIFDALEKKDYSVAQSLCKEQIDKHPKFIKLFKTILADIYINTEQYAQAEQILKPLVDVRPLVRASISLGKAYYLQNKLNEAIDVLQTVVQNSPLQIEAYQWLARSYKKNEELNKALTTLSYAATMTNHSIERHQEVAMLANEMNEYKIMISSYASILQLSRNSFYPSPCHLANYIRCIIEHAHSEKDLSTKKTILKQVNSALYQSRFEEGRNKDFDYNCFDDICQSKVFYALNEPLKAKRKVLSTLQKNTKKPEEFDDTLLCESLFSLLEIGEFDYATPFLQEIEKRNIIDPTMRSSLSKHTGDVLNKRINTFKKHNKLGIQAFSQKQFEDAITHFNHALELEALNSGALLNRVQAYIELLKIAKKDRHKEIFTLCQNSFILLVNTRLPIEHAKRMDLLQKEFLEMKGGK